MAEKPLTLVQVAERFGKRKAWLSRNIGRLQREHGFPRRIPGFGAVFDPLAIDAWLARQRAEGTSEAPAMVGPVAFNADEWAAVLDQRAAALAPAAGRA